MTINTELTIDYGLKSSDTMYKNQPTYIGGDFEFEAQAKNDNETSPSPSPKKYKSKKSEKAESARRALSALSRHLKGQRDLRIQIATSVAEKEALAMMSVNDLLIEHYQKKNGAKTFHKFKEWKTQGYAVKKGETAYRVWAAPRHAKTQGEVVRHDGSREDIENSFEFFPMCCLFSDLQVAPIETGEQSTKENTASL